MNTFLDEVKIHIKSSMSEKFKASELLSCNIGLNTIANAMLYGVTFKYNRIIKRVSLLVIPPQTKIDSSLEKQLIDLRDNTIELDVNLIVIHSEDDTKSSNDIEIFLSEHLDVFNPNYIRLACRKAKTLKTTIDGGKYLQLDNMLKNFYSDKIVFVGPRIGKQKVNLEIYKDRCNECKKEIHIVSGIVFPNIPLPTWNNFLWQYYNTLLPIYSIPKNYIKQIKQEVNKLKEANSKITPLIFYQNIECEEDDWTVMCPYCNSVIHKYYLEDKRMDYLHTMDSRISGDLHYHSVFIDADQVLINRVDDGGEFSPHSCLAGWTESKKIRL